MAAGGEGLVAVKSDGRPIRHGGTTAQNKGTAPGAAVSVQKFPSCARETPFDPDHVGPRGLSSLQGARPYSSPGLDKSPAGHADVAARRMIVAIEAACDIVDDLQRALYV